jgi:hypothetical protein
MAWINLDAIWKIVVFGLLAGAGLPALFAIGLLALSKGPRTANVGPDSEEVYGGSMAGAIAAGLCFLVVLAAVAWAIYEVYQIGHPK